MSRSRYTLLINWFINWLIHWFINSLKKNFRVYLEGAHPAFLTTLVVLVFYLLVQKYHLPDLRYNWARRHYLRLVEMTQEGFLKLSWPKNWFWNWINKENNLKINRYELNQIHGFFECFCLLIVIDTIQKCSNGCNKFYIKGGLVLWHINVRKSSICTLCHRINSA